jgi:transcriptional regulator with XRE-family HTH domain
VGRQGSGEPNEFSRALVDAVDALRVQRGVSTPALIARAGFSRGYYYKRTRGETSFSTNDVQTIAEALGVPVRTLLEPAITATDRRDPAATDDRPDAALIGYRLRKLVALHVARTPAPPVDRAVRAALAKRGRLLAGADWEHLLAGEPTDVTDDDLRTVAEFFDVPAEYLLRVAVPGIVDVLDARLEVETALAETGVGIAARSVNAASPAELLAIADAIRAAAPSERADQR